MNLKNLFSFPFFGYLLFGLLALTTFLLVFYYNQQVKKLKENKAKLESQQLSPAERKELGELKQKLEETVFTLQKDNQSSQQTVSLPSAECLIFKTDPLTGSLEKKEVDPEGLVYDFVYNGKILNLEETTTGPCQYSVLRLESVKTNQSFDLSLPKGLFFNDERLGKITAEALKGFIGKECKLTLRLQEKESGVWELLEWRGLEFLTS